jgi:very-short-patch-repair endonuclease
LISSNELLFDIFESDILIKVPITNDPNRTQAIIDIEVDGIHHKQKRKERFCMLRDKYLKSNGVVVFRIEVDVLSKMEDKELQKWLLESIASAIKKPITVASP